MQLLSIISVILSDTEAQQIPSFSIRGCFDNVRIKMQPTFQKLKPVLEKAKNVYIQLRDKYNELTERLYDKIMYGPRPEQINNDRVLEDYKNVLNQLKETLNKMKKESNSGDIKEGKETEEEHPKNPLEDLETDEEVGIKREEL